MEEEEEGREYVLYLPGPLTVKVEEVCGGGVCILFTWIPDCEIRMGSREEK